MIDIRNCCQEGMNIAMQRFSQAGGWTSQIWLEQDHMEQCQECNPALLVSKLFGQEVTIDSASIGLAHSQQVNQE